MRPFIALIALIALPSCDVIPPDGPAFSPVEVNKNIHAWNGRVVMVEGWLGECQPLNCGLYASMEDAQLVENWRWKSGEKPSNAWFAAMDRRLSIGASERFDFRAQFFGMTKVKVRGLVNNHCSIEGIACFDRADDLEPIQLYPHF